MVSSFFPFVLDLLLLDEPKSAVVRPPVNMCDGSADSAPAALTVDTTARTHVLKDPFLIDRAGVIDLIFSILGQPITSCTIVELELFSGTNQY